MKTDAVLIGVGALVLLLLANNSRAIASGAVSGAVGAVQGIGDAINASIINPAVRAVTGDPDATLGGKVWEMLHPREAYELKHGAEFEAPGSLGTTDPFEFG